MPSDVLDKVIAAVPTGPWAVGVSGGADSVALLTLLRDCPALHCHVVHLDHQTRGQASEDDARFVDRIASAWGIDRTITRRDHLEPHAAALPANPSARFRALRFALFRTVCQRHGLTGVILAHHADDQAETIVQRLLRGSGPAGLSGMSPDSRVGGLRILRPLLDVTADQLRGYLRAQGQPWREDASNASPAYQRNRVRAVLSKNTLLAQRAREMGRAMSDLTAWARACAPPLGETFAARELAAWPDVLAAQAARQWLADRGAPRDELSAAVLNRLIEMARDAATPPRRHFPGGILVSRRAGRLQIK